MGTRSGFIVALLVGASAYSGVSMAAEWTDHSRSLASSHAVQLAFPSVADQSDSPGLRHQLAHAAGPVRIRVRPPTFSGDLPSLEEGFAYVDLRRPVAQSVAWPPPPVMSVDAPTFKEALPELEEGFTGLRSPMRADPLRQSIRIA